MPRAVATLEAGKVNDGAGLLLHKRKDGGAQWLYRYTIHGRRREMGLGALRDVSLNKPVNWQLGGVLFYGIGIRIKTFKEKTKNAFYACSPMQKLLQHWKLAK